VSRAKTEWSGEPEDSDDQDAPASVPMRRATETFVAREKRLSFASQVLQQEKQLGDREVEVVQQGKEWAAAEESDEEPAAKKLERRHSESFQAREKRLSHAAVALEEEKQIGDQEVRVVPSEKDWAAADDSEDDHEPESAKLERQAAASFAVRERWLSARAAVMKQKAQIGDVEVEVVPQTKEWAGAQDSGDEREPQSRKLERRHSESFARREKRMSVNAPRKTWAGEKLVAVVAEQKEWKGLQDSDDEEESMERRASASFAAREKRLSVGAIAMQQNQVTDQEVPVMTHSREWSGEVDSGEETEAKAQRRASESFMARERRLSAGVEVLKAQRQMGDTEVEVVQQSKEWQGSENLPDSDDDQAFVAPEAKHEKQAAASFEAREKRLTIAAEALREQKPICDTEVPVVQQSKEWCVDDSSDDEQGEMAAAQHASEVYAARERRLTVGSFNAEENGDRDIVAVGRRILPGDDRCSDRCSEQCCMM